MPFHALAWAPRARHAASAIWHLQTSPGRPLVTQYSRSRGALPWGPFQACRWFCDGNAKQTGSVKMWSDDRGFGFITPAEDGDDIFVHRSSLNGCTELSAGQQVSYKIAWNERRNKPWAADVDAQVPWDVHSDGNQKMPAAATTSSSTPGDGNQKMASASTTSSSPTAGKSLNAGGESATPVRHRAATPTTPPREEEEPSAGSDGSLLKKLELQALEQQRHSVAQQEVADALTERSMPSQAVVPSSSVAASQVHLPTTEPMQVEPLQIPSNASVEQRLQLMTAHMEQLRLQGMQNQQLLLQGIYTMLQQQAAQTASLERTMLALADRMGASTAQYAGSPALGHGQQDSSPAALESSSSASYASRPRGEEQDQEVAKATLNTDGSLGQAQVAESALKDDTIKNRLPVAKVLEHPREERKMHSAEVRSHNARSDGTPATQALEKTETVRPSRQGEDDTPGQSATKDKQNKNTGAASPERNVHSNQDRNNAAGVPDSVDAAFGPDVSSKATAKRPAHRKSGNTKKLWTADSFHVVGSFNDWAAREGDVLPFSVKMRWTAPKTGDGDLRREEFQLLGDGSWDKRVYPAGRDESQEEAVPLLPGQASPASEGGGTSGHGRNWVLKGRPGTTFQISYDVDEQAVVCKRQ